MTDKQIIASKILREFVSKIKPYGGETNSHRECVNEITDEWRMVTHDEEQNNQIKHYVELSFKIAEEFLNHEG